MNRRLCWGVLLAFVLAWRPAPTTTASSWKPIDPAELALAAPKIDPAADAEILLWDVRIEDAIQGADIRSNWEQYLRVKIFTDRGREAFARVDIPHLGNVQVRAVEARCVKPDGTTTELKSSDVYERDILKAEGVKVKAVSFPLPGVERGSIIEYRWRESYADRWLNQVRLPFAREYPIHRVVYHVKPMPLRGMKMRAQPFRGRFEPLREDGDYYVISHANVPAFREEPRGPSQWDVKPWVLVAYQDYGPTTDPQGFWRAYARSLWEAGQKTFEVTPAIRAAAREATATATTLENKLAALLEAARTRVHRTDVGQEPAGDEKKRKEAKDAGEAFDRCEGSGWDLVNVFIAMAKAVEIDARPAYLPSRDDVTFDRNLALPSLLTERVVAVRDGTGWRFLDPAHRYDATGHLRWMQEGQPVLVPDQEGLPPLTTPAAGPEWSLVKRTGKLTLSEDGTLEGDVRIEYHGHPGLRYRELESALSAEERVKRLQARVAERLPSGEITQIAIEHVTDTDGPCTVRYHVRAPGYAQRTGSRLFLQPSVFERGEPAEFASATRLAPMVFEYPWSEHDEVSIALPAGFALEAPDAPANVTLPGAARSSLKLARTTDDTRIDLTRDFVFGESTRLKFPVSVYPQIKGFFDGVRKQDDHAVTLRRKEATR